MKPEDRKRLKRHIEMIVEHKMPIVFCPNCEKDVECIHTAELYECKECGEDFARYIVSRQPAKSDVSMTQDVSTDIKTPQSIENTNPDYYKQDNDRLTAELAELRERTRWIPVSEGLPEDSGRYICAIRYNEEPKKMWVEQRFWNIFGWDMYTSIVTHWMPLPPPPEATDADN